MRTITVNGQPVNEEIKSYDYNLGAFVRVVVGTGSIVNGSFVFTAPQQYDTVMIQNEEGLTNSMTGEVIKPAITDLTQFETEFPDGAFTINDLWRYVDAVRARR